MRGIVSAAGYVPFRRLDRSEISALFGGGGGKGTRAVAAHDEDTSTLGVEAARLALRSRPGLEPGALWFATATPAYLDKTNATVLHAALRLPGEVPAFDFGGALRSAAGALQTALTGSGTVMVVSADTRDGLATSADESGGGDAGAAIVVGDDGPGASVIAAWLGTGSATDEFLDRWRVPGDRRSRTWEERFGETRYLALGGEAWDRALKSAGLSSDEVDRVIITGMHARATKALARRLHTRDGTVGDDLAGTVGQAGAAHPALVLASVLEEESRDQGDLGSGRVVALVHLADGADVFLFRTTDALGAFRPARPVRRQIDHGSAVGYGKFLSWREMVQLEPPRRPEPQRVSSSAAWRSEEWKFGFVGSKDRGSGAVHLPPARISMKGGALDDMEPMPMAEVQGTVVTFTIDRMAYSPSPPTVFAVVDFDGGGRFPVELTDVDATNLAIGDRVEMTFRRLFTADGIHDYFWKARPVPKDLGEGSDQ
ncbi:MAG: OB-fold domain-containing protein [Acidimicrobiales bacterium]